MPAFLWIAPVPALGAALFASRDLPLVLDWAPYHVTLLLDGPGAILLTTSSLLWIAAGAYAGSFFGDAAIGASFTVCWLLTLIGSVGIFLVADLPGFLVFYALVSLPAWGLVVYDGTPSARHAGAIYVGFALLGEGLLLVGFVLLAMNSPAGSFRIAEAVATFGTSPFRNVILALLIVGFGMKVALVPLHFWMPLAYTATPIPAAAVLSGAAVKAGFIGLIRFLPFAIALPHWGAVLTAVGLCGAFYGVAIGITQTDPKTILAYSSVSQMGFLVAVLGMGLAAGNGGVVLIAAFYAAHHVLVKGALFLSVGVARATDSAGLGIVLIPGFVIGLGLAGLPLTGGALAKLAVKDPLGYGMAGALATLASSGTALLMLHFLRRLTLTAAAVSSKRALTGLVVPWMAMALASVAVPWILYPVVGIGSLSEAIAPAMLWKALWPVLFGGLLAVGLRRWGHKLPHLPAGDIVIGGAVLTRVAAFCGAAMERVDALLRQWQIAVLSLVIVAILLAVAMMAGG